MMLPFIVAIAVGLTGLGWFFYRGMSRFTDTADAISDSLIARYVGLLEAGEYGEAWSTCLAPSLQGQVSQQDFVAAQAARAEEHGPLTGWTQTTYQHEANLFSRESELGVRGVLHYERRDVFVQYKVDLGADPPLIHQAFGSEGSSGTLSEGTW